MLMKYLSTPMEMTMAVCTCIPPLYQFATAISRGLQRKLLLNDV